MYPWSVWSAAERRIGIFTSFYWAALTAYALGTDARHTWVYVPLMVLLIGAVVAVHDRWPLTTPVLWGLSLWGLAHMAGGLIDVPKPIGTGDILYTVWLWGGVLRYDQVVHCGGLIVATIAFAHIVEGSRRPLLWALLLGQALGVVNEVVEQIGTLALPTANVGDAVNTAWDLAWNAFGGVSAVMLLSRRRSRPAPSAVPGP